MNIYEELAAVKGRDGFIEFVHRLTKDLEKNGEEWANVTLKDYLLGIASWVEDGVHEQDEQSGRMPGASVPRRADVEWERLAFLLFAAGRYE
ncbi:MULTISPECIES: DUF7660 family protein [Saccharibacillus]|uniref:DUF7660 family protein n=1 Tax=Saccharibacillus TaxID=456492 RepID=UPI001239A6B9|nr:hypothetical protein [Saccharibacillus sp. WB 17]MWJ31269.1 hypothetical protein [Saccharibacillus sp. WB 17]